MILRLIAGVAAAAVLPFGPAVAQDGEEIRADIVDTGGQTLGEATVREAGAGLLIRVELRGLQPGPHGMHLHVASECDSLGGFETAGDHIAQTGQEHGLRSRSGPHDGDLPNLIVGADGVAIAEFETARVSLRGAQEALLDDDGSALIIHAHGDDHMDPNGGGSGARVACAAFEADAVGTPAPAE